MATFKVGQRVKYVSGILPHVPVGTEGTILGFSALGPVDVDFTPVIAAPLRGTTIAHVFSTSIVPLTDPKADAFIERVKSWKPEPAPVALPERETHARVTSEPK